ncbi:hydroxymethylglutaryl-CoA lyase [Geminicoccus harenae]|uniref:hydroxymethylglutaryl-CoA lyase n=1 Tax=Geminicoccus harenae TaxID=2498453 RepID=UPI001CC30FF3|nr:hydroxymethylglutaryl-CoA lyase [Geminicoccus harenae]
MSLDPLAGVPPEVRIVEVGPRDGLQNETRLLGVEQRIAMIRGLAGAGLSTIEAGAFVRFDLVPAMAGSDAVLEGLRDLEDVRLPVLVPNRRGLRTAIDAGAREVAVFAAASETFSQRNGGAGIEATLARIDEVAAKAKGAGLGLRGYLSCVAGCPFEGEVPVARVVEIAEALAGMGCGEISLGDTIGIGTPARIAEVVRACAASVGIDRLAIHAHDTMGQALANVLIALELGVRTVDSSVAGLGGCPFAPGAAGNLATEDLVYLLEGLGVRHGVEFDRLVAVGETVTALLGREGSSRAAAGHRRRNARAA